MEEEAGGRGAGGRNEFRENVTGSCNYSLSIIDYVNGARGSAGAGIMPGVSRGRRD